MRVSLLFVLALCVALSVGDQVQSFKPAGLNPPPDVNTIFIFGSNLAFGTDNGQYTFPATPTFTPTQMTYRFTAQLKANLETLYKHTIEVVDLSIWDGRIEQITAQIAKVTGTRTGSSLVIIDYLHNYLLDIILGKDDTQYYSQPINGIPRSGGLWQTAYTEAQRQAQVAKLYGRVASVPLQDKQEGLTGTSFQNFQTRIKNAVAAINAQVNAQTGGPFGKSVQFWMVNAFDPFAGLGRIYKAPSDIISTQFAYKDMNPVAEAIPFAYHVWNVMLAELAGSISAGVLDAYGLFSTRTLGSAVPGAEDFVSVTRPVLTSSTDPLVPNQTGHTALATLATASITTNVPAVNVDANGGATAATTVADGSGSTSGSGSGSGSTTSTSPTTSITLSFGGMFSGVTA